MAAEYFMAFTTGFLGGFGHCIGMCGPIVASYSLQDTSTPVLFRFLPHALYNTGRIATYMFIGAVMGLSGSLVNVAGKISGIQNVIALTAGLFMVLMGLNISGVIGKPGWFERQGSLIMQAGKELHSERTAWRYLLLGGLFGFLPCGFSYAAFAAAAGTGNMLSGMLLMLSFGLGTAPALLLFGMAASVISLKLRGALYKSAGVVVIAMGVFFLYRGIKMMM